MEKLNNVWITIVAMICITALEIIALLQGINGVLLTAIVAILAGLGGYVLPQPKKFLEN